MQQKRNGLIFLIFGDLTIAQDKSQRLNEEITTPRFAWSGKAENNWA
jgi:hypothetical protein